MPLDLSLYLIVDGIALDDLERIALAIDHGVTAIQLRQKSTSMQAKYQFACALRQLTRDKQVPFIINDHVDIALAVDADGVHVGQSDLPVHVVRQLIGKHKYVGLSTSAQQHSLQLPIDIDYLGVGPIFTSLTKSDAAPPIGLHGLQTILQLHCMPMVAIGGINASNIAAIRELGVGVAVSAAICQASDVAHATRSLC